MAKYTRAKGIVEQWIGEDLGTFGVQAFGGGTAPVIVNQLRTVIPSEWGLTDDVLQAIAGCSIARVGSGRGRLKILRAFGCGMVKQLAMKLIAQYVHPGGSVVIESPKTVQPVPSMPPMNLSNIAERQANSPLMR